MRTLSVLLGLVAALALAACQDRRPPAASLPPAPDLHLVPPLNDAAVGEELVLRRGEQEWLYRVAQATDTEVVVEVIEYGGGVPVGKPRSFQWHRNGFGVPDDVVVRGIEPAKLEIGGENVSCWLLRGHSARGTFAFWISEDAPVHGLLKMAKVEDGRPEDAGALIRVR